MRCSCGQENPLGSGRCQRCGQTLWWGADPKRLARDAGIAAALLLALGVVFLLDRGRGPSQNDAADRGAKLEVVDEGAETPLLTNPMRLAVTPPEFDDMGKLLDALGAGYRYATVDMDDLLDAERLGRYDVVFLTCGGVPREWLGRFVRPGEREGGGVFRARPEIVARLKQSLRDYVARGGTLYASDWQFELLAIAFPERIDRARAVRGAVQTVQAEVVAPGLRHRLGPVVELRFDKPSWCPAAFRGPDLSVYVSGAYQTIHGAAMSGPLLVRFPFEGGNVIFTSFHNEKQNSETEMELLRHLVFTTVTAQLDADIARTMVRGGFSPTDRNLLSASPKDQSVAQTYRCEGARSLQFVLGFADRGARLRLRVEGPDGRRVEKTGDSTLTIDVADAAAGEWTYTVAPLRVPYENFPFTVTVGERP